VNRTSWFKNVLKEFKEFAVKDKARQKLLKAAPCCDSEKAGQHRRYLMR
jgi:hypothetical protein